MTIDLDNLKRLAQAAQESTPGPWVRVTGDVWAYKDTYAVLVASEPPRKETGAFIAACSPDVVLELAESRDHALHFERIFREALTAISHAIDMPGSPELAADVPKAVEQLVNTLREVRERVATLEAERIKHSQRADVAQSDCGELKDALGEVVWAPIRLVVEKARAIVAERDALRERVAELEAEMHQWRNGHKLQAFEEDHRHEVLAQIDRANAAERRVAELEAERDAARDVVNSAREVVSWDWLRLLVDCADSETVQEDVKRLDGALAALDEVSGEHVADVVALKGRK